MSGFGTKRTSGFAAATTMVVMVNSNADAVAVWNFVRGIVKIITPDHPWPAPPSTE
jgi:D-alanyl-D-alanine carboxypeptidase